MRWLKDKFKFQVLLEDGLLVAVAPENTIREETRGAEGKERGMQRKEQLIKKRMIRKISRLKRAREYWEKRSQIQTNPGTSNQRETQNKETRTIARVLRTFEPKTRTTINHNNNNGMA